MTESYFFTQKKKDLNALYEHYIHQTHNHFPKPSRRDYAFLGLFFGALIISLVAIIFAASSGKEPDSMLVVALIITILSSVAGVIVLFDKISNKLTDYEDSKTLASPKQHAELMRQIQQASYPVYAVQDYLNAVADQSRQDLYQRELAVLSGLIEILSYPNVLDMA